MDIVESAYWEAAYTQFDAAWRARWKGKLAGYPIEEIERWMKPTTEASADAVERIEHAGDADLRWLKAALQHARRKWFVANTARGTQKLPEALFEPMLLAGIEEPHPDFNRNSSSLVCARLVTECRRLP